VTKSERRDYRLFMFCTMGIGLNAWGMFINAFWYVFKGDAPSIIWLMVNLISLAVVTEAALKSLRLRGISRLLDLTEDAIEQAMRAPTAENAQKVIDLHAQTEALVAKRFPQWNKGLRGLRRR
jgi:hypothetical protein